MRHHPPCERLAAVTLDAASIGRGTPDQEHERRIAIANLIEDNHFHLEGTDRGPYRLDIGVQDNKLVLAVSGDSGDRLMTHVLSLQPLRAVMKDYLRVIDAHYDAAHHRAGAPGRLEAIDMGRRSLHNEGATLLGERLKGKVATDHDTLRRLFTLLTALHWKG